ncbi:unnamed protein product [Pleuronectes platessa]|uniref:Uncharacterized protein n=1 Tax=Pleuronectes platessa TaxID=8262 RepID=A0A9N7Y9P8_PLEPL|nr:unnamed protein product [Pleuronectes platessa]
MSLPQLNQSGCVLRRLHLKIHCVQAARIDCPILKNYHRTEELIQWQTPVTVMLIGKAEEVRLSPGPFGFITPHRGRDKLRMISKSQQLCAVRLLHEPPSISLQSAPSACPLPCSPVTASLAAKTLTVFQRRRGHPSAPNEESVARIKQENKTEENAAGGNGRDPNQEGYPCKNKEKFVRPKLRLLEFRAAEKERARKGEGKAS